VETAPQIIASWSIAAIPHDPLIVGAKVTGLLRVPRNWVPPFIVMTAAFYRSIRRNGVAEALGMLTGTEQLLIYDFLKRMSELQRRVLVRSNGPGEDLRSRGAFQSLVIHPTLENLTEAIAQVVRVADPTPMYPVLQEAIEPGVLGHMSNERRVSPKRTRWLVEGLDGASSNMLEARRRDQSESLEAASEKQVLQRLRGVASSLGDQEPSHFHCEWVWSGRRVWIVQVDPAPVQPSDKGIDEYLQGTDVKIPRFSPTRDMVHFSDDSTSQWSKLDRPKMFRSLGMPVADVFVISGVNWCSDRMREQLERDVAAMCRVAPVVVRCDVSKLAGATEILLPTSPSTQNAQVLFAFMDRVAEQFAAKGLSVEMWAFLLAFLVPARASAMAHARPKAERVRVDAIWGYPDGLSFFAHDSWFYYPADRNVTELRRYKGTCLLPSEAGWTPALIGPPYDWHGALDENEVKTIAAWALELANKLDSEIQLMALAKIGDATGSASCLPWHYTTWEVPQYTESLRMLPPISTIRIVTSKDDLDRFRHVAPRNTVRGYYIRPDAPLLRDNAFLEDVASLARMHDRPLYFEGSVLGHAYYVMARAGATVIPVNEDEPEEAGKQYNKLVRDNIPMVIRRAGGLARVRHVSAAEARSLLKQKLIEEAFEVRNSGDSALADELADVLEVVEALREYASLTAEQLERVRQEKRKKRGGFDQAVYLESTTLRPLRFPSDANGRLPLFGSDEMSPRARGSSPGGEQIVEGSLENGKYLARFLVSLIPPVDGIERSQSFSLGSLAATVDVTYGNTIVEVSISPSQPPSPPNQLALFPNDMEEVPS
jgi:predicted house-cleaning noncanonical NTP pyrophosphatase (MazG superfamily)